VADTPILIIDYQPRWPAEFSAAAARLRHAFGDTALAIRHIGSTSVPGLAAKDVIDLQVTIAALDPLGPLESAITAAGFRMRPDIQGDHRPEGAQAGPEVWRKRYARELDGERRTHVHIRVQGWPNERYPVLFRDYLRANAAAARSYATIKRELARRHADDVDAYYDVKDPVMDLIMDAAERWAAQSAWALPASDA
jgi:GrpB-like predicted nucleotidyltransferase (UPF0157 family)